MNNRGCSALLNWNCGQICVWLAVSHNHNVRPAWHKFISSHVLTTQWPEHAHKLHWYKKQYSLSQSVRPWIVWSWYNHRVRTLRSPFLLLPSRRSVGWERGTGRQWISMSSKYSRSKILDRPVRTYVLPPIMRVRGGSTGRVTNHASKLSKELEILAHIAFEINRSRRR